MSTHVLFSHLIAIRVVAAVMAMTMCVCLWSRHSGQGCMLNMFSATHEPVKDSVLMSITARVIVCGLMFVKACLFIVFSFCLLFLEMDIFFEKTKRFPFHIKREMCVIVKEVFASSACGLFAPSFCRFVVAPLHTSCCLDIFVSLCDPEFSLNEVVVC